jgi:hypothetical protein
VNDLFEDFHDRMSRLVNGCSVVTSSSQVAVMVLLIWIKHYEVEVPEAARCCVKINECGTYAYEPDFTMCA